MSLQTVGTVIGTAVVTTAICYGVDRVISSSDDAAEGTTEEGGTDDATAGPDAGTPGS